MWMALGTGDPSLLYCSGYLASSLVDMNTQSSAKEQVLGVSTVVAGVEEAKTKNLLICIVHANHGLKKWKDYSTQDVPDMIIFT